MYFSCFSCPSLLSPVFIFLFCFASFMLFQLMSEALVVVQALKSSPNLCWDSEEETMSFKSVLD